MNLTYGIYNSCMMYNCYDRGVRKLYWSDNLYSYYYCEKHIQQILNLCYRYLTKYQGE